MSKTSLSRSFNAAARQLAQVFGPCLTQTSIQDSLQTPRRTAEWAISLVELLIQAHEGDRGSAIWEVGVAFMEEIRDGVWIVLTPRRSANSTPRRSANSTPRRSANSTPRRNGSSFHRGSEVSRRKTVGRTRAQIGATRAFPGFGNARSFPSAFSAIQASTRSFGMGFEGLIF
jgi:hypothetical protein